MAALMTLLFANDGWGQRIIAHRGASYDAPENTLAAFQLAWHQGADGIEGDFHLTKDGHIVCIHDETTKRTGRAGSKVVDLKVAESTLATLRRLDVGRWKHRRFAGQRIPTLGEVLAMVPKGKLFFVELKVGPEIVAPLKTVLDESSIEPEQVIIISFNAHTIRQAKKTLPDVKAHLLTGFRRPEGDRDWKRASPTLDEVVRALRYSGADGLGVHANAEVVDRAFLDAVKAMGIREYHVWTVDQPRPARHFLRLGAYSITTNRPAYLRKAL